MVSAVPAVIIGAPTSGSGKTTVATGLMGALRAAGHRVAPFKVGPDFIDPGYHALAAGRPGRNLDPVLVGEDLIPGLYGHGCIGADIAVVEGVMGLFDGRIEDQFVTPARGSTAQVARMLGAPVLLVVDVRGQSQSIAAVLQGFSTFCPGVRIGGVILNRVGSPRHEQVLRSACEAVGVPVLRASGRTGEGVEQLRDLVPVGRTMALLGASGVGKSTLINALVGGELLRTSEVRENDQRGRHTTTACELVRLPGDDHGWLIDTPGVRAVSLWSSGHGIERAFRDVFDLSERCRFRDCKHEDEPGCAVHRAIELGRLDPRRLDAMKRLVAEEAALEAEQRAWEKAQDRRGVRKQRPR